MSGSQSKKLKSADCVQYNSMFKVQLYGIMICYLLIQIQRQMMPCGWKARNTFQTCMYLQIFIQSDLLCRICGDIFCKEHIIKMIGIVKCNHITICYQTWFIFLQPLIIHVCSKCTLKIVLLG